jgi:hypothetical protein
LPGGGALCAHGEIEALSGPLPTFEVRFAYNRDPMAVTRHSSLESAVNQSERLKQFLADRGWQVPTAS